MTKSLAVEGTVFWIIAATIFDLFGVPFLYTGPDPLLVLTASVVVSAIYLVLAYMCFIPKRRAFAAASLLALVLVGTDVLVSRLQYPGDQLIAMMQLLVAFFGYRGYRELKESH